MALQLFLPNLPGIIFTFQATWFIPNNNKNLRDDTPDNTSTPGNVVCLLMADTPTNVLVRLIMFNVLLDYSSLHFKIPLFTVFHKYV